MKTWFVVVGGALAGAALVGAWAGRKLQDAQTRETALVAELAQIKQQFATVQATLQKLQAEQAAYDAVLEADIEQATAEQEAWLKSLPVDRQMQIAMQDALHQPRPNTETPPQADDEETEDG
jgi:hypothetical protein